MSYSDIDYVLRTWNPNIIKDEDEAVNYFTQVPSRHSLYIPVSA